MKAWRKLKLKMKVELISWTKDPIKTVEKAAAQCYASEPSLKVVKHCIKSNHLSILEQCNFTFEIQGVSRALLAQLTRHRTGSYSVRSQRYTNEGNFDYYTPNSIKYGPPTVQKLYDDTMEFLKDVYSKLIAEGIKQEDARNVLPNACCTNLVMTFDLRNLGHFCNERLCYRSQNEINQLAKQIKKAIFDKKDEMGLNNEELELINSFLVPKCEVDGVNYCREERGCGLHPQLEQILKDKNGEK